MPTVGVATVPELDAAEALLELQSESRQSPVDGDNDRWEQSEVPQAMESTATATLSLRPRTDSNVLPNSNYAGPSAPTIVKVSNGYIIKNNKNLGTHYKHVEPNKKRPNLHKKHQKEQKRWYKVHNAPHRESKKTCDKGTQTEVEYQHPQILKMDSIITELCEKIRSLEEQLNARRIEAPSNSKTVPNASEIVDARSTESDHRNHSRRNYERKAKSTIDRTPSVDSDEDNDDDDSEYKTESEIKEDDMDISDDDSEEYGYSCKVVRKSNQKTSSDLVPIGDGNASVPARLLRQLDWSSYTNATRKLLTAVFSRRVLATHSLTGKRSPAFPDKPAKKKLDPALVSDIIQTVVERCCVPENVVRTSITTKCADESKMFRSRQQNKKKRQSFKKENIPPTASKSEGALNTTY